MSFKVPNQYRIKRGPMGSDDSIGLCGAFEIHGMYKKQAAYFYVIAIDGEGLGQGWEHVSVHGRYTNNGAEFTPNWEVMSKIKDLFWDEEDCVVEFHPPKSEYVNRHIHTLHLWRNPKHPISLPPKELIG